LDQDTVMTAENLVDAALAGLDKGEAITWPTVADASLWDMYDAARSTLFVWQAGRALQRRMTSLRERKSFRLGSNSRLPRRGGLMNHRQDPSHARAEARIAMIGASSNEPVEREIKTRIEWTRDHYSLSRSILGTREEHMVWRFRCRSRTKMRSTPNDPRRHFHSTSG
jgi:hypothetical protein